MEKVAEVKVKNKVKYVEVMGQRIVLTDAVLETGYIIVYGVKVVLKQSEKVKKSATKKAPKGEKVDIGGEETKEEAKEAVTEDIK